MWRRSKSRPIFTSMICLVEGGVGIRMLVFDICESETF